MSISKKLLGTLALVAGIVFLADTAVAQQDNLIDTIKKRGKLQVGFGSFLPWAIRDKQGQLGRLRDRRLDQARQGHGRRARFDAHRVGRHHSVAHCRQVRCHHRRPQRHSGAPGAGRLHRAVLAVGAGHRGVEAAGIQPRSTRKAITTPRSPSSVGAAQRHARRSRRSGRKRRFGSSTTMPSHSRK